MPRNQVLLLAIVLLALPWAARAVDSTSSAPPTQDTTGLTPPEVVSAESVRIVKNVKTIIVGNNTGHYVLLCNVGAEGCANPIPKQKYFLFTKDTHWTMPGATTEIGLKFIQDWTVSYPDVENIGLVPKDPGGRGEFGMYILQSWIVTKH
jgi:hypothetical protein